MKEHGDAVALLSLLGIQGVGPAKVSKVLSRAQETGSRLSELLRTPKALPDVISPEQQAALGGSWGRAVELAAQVERSGGQFVTITDPSYPAALRARLGRGAPPLLSVLGNTDLLSSVGVGFCGSRAATEKGLETVSDCAEQLARAHLSVISGYAAGVDMSAHRAALHAGGHTTVVLAEGILQFTVKRKIKDVWDLSRVVVVSEFVPDRVWSVHNAMRRNRTICGLSQAMILIEARATGGSVEAGKTCLDLGIPLFVAVYQGMPESAEGNRQMLDRGALPLLKSRASGRANLSPVLQRLHAHETTSGSTISASAGRVAR